MARYEFTKGTSNKFWEITLSQSSLITRFGRIGTEGQISKKRFADAAAAKKAYDALVREKEKKGYVPVGRSKKPAVSTVISKAVTRAEPKKPTTASKSRTPSGDDAGQVREALAALDKFLADAAKRPPLALELLKRVPPVKAAAISAFEGRTGRALSPGARELFLTGFPTCVIAGDAEFGFGRLDFEPLAKIAARLKWWGDWQCESDAIGESRDPGLLRNRPKLAVTMELVTRRASG